MPLSQEQILMLGAAGGAVLLILLVVALWRWASLRQRLEDREQRLQQLVAEQEALAGERHQLQTDLFDSEAENRARTVELRQLVAQLDEKRETLDIARSELATLTGKFNALANEHTQLKTRQAEREDRHQEQIGLLNEARENLKREFENLAHRIFEDKGKSFTSTNREALEALLKPFREQISGFQHRINQVHTESVKGQTALEAEIRKVLEVGLEMNTQATNLTAALKGDKKTTGNWGEAQLQRTLELAGLLEGEHYESQSVFKDGEGKRRLPDFLIKLPDGKHLVIDSKVSLVDYDRAIAADSEEERDEALEAHARAVRNHVDDLASKAYAEIPEIDSPDFVLMFMPVEPAYIEAMKHNKDLFNYGYQKGVVMVSHTTLMPILRTVANLWMIDKSNREAREISNRAGEIYNQVCLVAERLHKLGNTLRAAGNHYNDTVRGLVGKQGLHGKVERFQTLSSKASKEMSALEAIHSDIENDRLESLDESGSPETAELQESTKDAPKLAPVKSDSGN